MILYGLAVGFPVGFVGSLLYQFTLAGKLPEKYKRFIHPMSLLIYEIGISALVGTLAGIGLILGMSTMLINKTALEILAPFFHSIIRSIIMLFHVDGATVSIGMESMLWLFSLTFILGFIGTCIIRNEIRRRKTCYGY